MPTFTGSSIASTYNRVIFRDSTESSAGSGCKIQFTSNDGASDVTSNLYLATDSIGIGTASPVSALDIRDGLTTGGSVLTLATKETSVVASDVLGRINFYAPLENTGGTTGDQRLPGASIAAVAQATFSNTVNSTALAFETGTSETAVGQTRMLIDEDGNVGIGTDDPAFELHVAGTDPRLLVAEDTNHFICLEVDGISETVSAITWDNARELAFGQKNASTGTSVASERMRIDLNGNVGIGDTAPTESKLSIDNVASGDGGLKVVRNLAEAGSFPLVLITDDHASNTQPALKIQQDGAGYGIQIDQNGNHSALFIDSEGDTAHLINVADPVITAGNGLHIADCNALTTGSIAKFKSTSTALESTATGGMVEVVHAGNSTTNVNNLLYVHNDHASATGTTGIYVQQDSTGDAIYATGGGIVEQGGVLKENLLTNSGFDVWSNSTLENVGSELVTNGTMEADSTWTAYGTPSTEERSNTQAHAGTYSWKVVTDGGDEGIRNSTAIAITLGKLYRVSVWIYNTSASRDFKITLDNSSGTLSTEVFQETIGQNAWTEISAVVECTESGSITTQEIRIVDSGTTAYIDDFSLYEVTPGIVGANSLGPDGWGKGTDTDLWRQEHIDVGHASNKTNSYNGSYYGLKITGANHSYQCFQGLSRVERFRGRTVTMGCWVKSPNGAGQGGVAFDNSGTGVTSSMTTGTGWEWLELTVTCSATGTYFYPACHTTNTHTAYFSQPICVFGSSIGEGNYTRPQGEIVYMENAPVLNSYSAASISSNATILLEQESNGKVPKGAKAVQVEFSGTPSATDKYLVFRGASANPFGGGWCGIKTLVASKSHGCSGWLPCDANGDIYIERNDTFTSSNLYINGVQLR